MSLMARAARLLKTEGVRGLMLGIARFGSALVQRAFWWGRFNVSEFVLTEFGDMSQTPPVAGLEVHVVECEDDAGRLARGGYEDFRLAIGASRRRLESGVVAFCVYVGSEVAHIGWVALSEQAKPSVDPLPYKVVFDDGEACTGGTFTMPKFRGRNLMACGYYERFGYLRERGYVSSRNAVAVTNVASQKAHARFTPTVHGVGRYTKLLWRTLWKEETLAASGLKAPVSRLQGHEERGVAEDGKA